MVLQKRLAPLAELGVKLGIHLLHILSNGPLYMVFHTFLLGVDIEGVLLVEEAIGRFDAVLRYHGRQRIKFIGCQSSRCGAAVGWPLRLFTIQAMLRASVRIVCMPSLSRAASPGSRPYTMFQYCEVT